MAPQILREKHFAERSRSLFGNETSNSPVLVSFNAIVKRSNLHKLNKLKL
jgi:hypothetical protein